ncbi:MAG TPA: hypothetical protein DD420_20740 [Streptomyces sp.]|uniref:Uncharacterized protein n=1 Tax=Streptomyces halstedii TaxID=1944 RepID=A0A6N9TW54_STRHA|nr:hypothetical protein [Streptomyces halstedii]NEA15547.1 hypothetical protein [Streptomyces halstedii]HBF82263.1 hypothetical protein [Streptomyces sp.]
MGEQDTSIKTTKDVRDRLRLLAEERGTTMNELLGDLVGRELTYQEREERARQAVQEVKELTGTTASATARSRARAFLRSLEIEHRDGAA